MHYDKKTKVWEVPLTSLSSLINEFRTLDEIKLTLLKDKTTKENPVIDISKHKFKTKPFNYQIDGINFGVNHNNWLLLDAPGLGKTLQVCYIASELKKMQGLKHCLIICGVNTLKFNWKSEIEKHTNLSCRILGQKLNKKGNLIIGSVQDRVKDLESNLKEFFIITNIETLRSPEIVKAITKGKNNFDMVVVDEIHCCKNPTSIQSKNLLKLNKAKYKIGLTGTIITNNPLDCYLPLKWLGKEKATYSNFKYYYCKYGGPFNSQLLGYRHTDILKDQLASCSLRRTKDILDLPPKTIINEYIDLNNKQYDFYNNIKQGIISQVDKVNITTTSLLAMVARLRQATAFPQMLSSENIGSSKIERCIDLADQIISNGDKVVIFSTFKATADELLRQLKHYNPLLGTGDVKDDEIKSNIEKFQTDEKYKVFIATHQKCGTGITLTASNYVIFIDTPWTSALYEQAQDRCYRIGSKKPVTIYNLIAKDTIDERVLEIVNDKQAISEYIVDDQITTSGIASLRKWIQELQ